MSFYALLDSNVAVSVLRRQKRNTGQQNETWRQTVLIDPMIISLTMDRCEELISKLVF